MWLIIIALATGLAYAGLLYLFNCRQHYGKPLTAVLFALRAIVVAIVMMLFFNPYIKQKINKIEQPTVIFAQDNSASITLSKDSVFYKQKYPQLIDSVKDILSDDYNIDTSSFGGDYTNISQTLNDIKRLYYKRNVGAVVLLSDGIVNQGVEPEFNASSFPFPIYSVTLGDTASYPDLMIQSVKCNKTVPASMAFPLRVDVNAYNAKNAQVEVTVKVDGAEVENTSVDVTNNRFSKTLNFNITPDGSGMKQIDIQLSGLSGEQQLLNNHRRLFIEVVDRKYRILCYAKAPHPDIAAIKSALGDHFEVETVFANSRGIDIDTTDGYNLLIVHQLAIPENVNGIDTKSLPVLAIVGPASDLEEFNASQNVVAVKKGAVSANLDIKARFNSGFGLFTIGSDIKSEISTYPPLTLPHIEMSFEANHDDLMFMNINDIQTSNPLLTFSSDAKGRKIAVMFGTGCWRWKLYEYYHHRNHEGFEEIFSKTVKYLLTERDKELIINHKESYLTTEAISFTAELRNPSRELINEPELNIRIFNKQTKDVYDYVFAKGDGNYHLNIGMLPEGIYTFNAKAELGGIEYSANGNFTVVALGIEAQDLTAKIERMRSLAEQTGGKHYYITDIQQLTKDLRNDQRITSVSHEETRYDDLINLKWLLISVIALITIEWILRKAFGGY